eukprot:scaffold5347_cov130-Cylindrotheca_fusiformis.AAC.10
MSSSSSSQATHWLPSSSSSSLQNDDDDSGTSTFSANALCLGTGRFLRSVLVPSLVGAGLRPALIQTRGRSFLEFMNEQSNTSDDDDNNNTYPVDTVLPSGDIQTDTIPCWGAFSLGQAKDKEYFLKEYLVSKQLNHGISILGVGVTEAGLASKDTQAMKDLYDIFQSIQKLIHDKKWDLNGKKICVLDMDNVPNNGDTIRGYMEAWATQDNDEMTTFFQNSVVFLNTMVDRITSCRDGHPMIPRCEPMPAKALVVLDPENNLPPLFQQQPGVVVRNTVEELQLDIALKLKIANGTHTAVAHLLALLRMTQTDVLSSSSSEWIMTYLDSLVKHQIIPSVSIRTSSHREEAKAVYEDWRGRLLHPHFGLSTFFITQNGPAKGGIRWGPTIVDLIQQQQQHNLQWSFAFAYAVLLRWLTPIPGGGGGCCNETGYVVCTGWLDGVEPTCCQSNNLDTDGALEYADYLAYNLDKGWYQYKCPLKVDVAADEGGQTKTIYLTELLEKCIGTTSPEEDCCNAVRAYMFAPEGGGNLGPVQDKLDDFVKVVASIYARLLSGEGLESVLQGLKDGADGIFLTTPCNSEGIEIAMHSAPASMPIV